MNKRVLIHLAFIWIIGILYTSLPVYEYFPCQVTESYLDNNYPMAIIRVYAICSSNQTKIIRTNVRSLNCVPGAVGSNITCLYRDSAFVALDGTCGYMMSSVESLLFVTILIYFVVAAIDFIREKGVANAT